MHNVGVEASEAKTPSEPAAPTQRGPTQRGPTRRGLDRGNRRRRYVKPLERITAPMLRVNGELRAATWDEALDRAAQGLAQIRDQHGGEAVGMFSCSKSTNEMNYAAQKFMRCALGSNNIDSCNRT